LSSSFFYNYLNDVFYYYDYIRALITKSAVDQKKDPGKKIKRKETAAGIRKGRRKPITVFDL